MNHGSAIDYLRKALKIAFRSGVDPSEMPWLIDAVVQELVSEGIRPGSAAA